MRQHFLFNRMEFSGSLGDLGTILPLTIAMVIINGVDAFSAFFCFGLYYIFSGLYFKVTSPVEPMKIVAAYAIASGLSITQIQASSLLLSVILLIFGATGLITFIRKGVQLAVIRGVQLSTGLLLIMKGVQLISGTSPFQKIHGAVEPHLTLQHLGPVPFSFVLGIFLCLVTLLLLNNKKVPAAIFVVCFGLITGILFHKPSGQTFSNLGISFPELLPYGLPTIEDLGFAMIILVLPQLPMTIGNAVIANEDLTAQYFPETGRKVTARSLCLSMGLANFFSFLLGGLPMCHGAGGLASRYRFGARTAGSNLIIGGILVSLALVLGSDILMIINLIPMGALGVLLIFAGAQLSLTLLDVSKRKDLFVVIIMLGITLASNLAAAFLIGIFLALLMRSKRISV